MSDLSDGSLQLVRAASIARMSKPEREQYLRPGGWRRLRGGKQQKWVSANGLVATLAGACQPQALADLESM